MIVLNIGHLQKSFGGHPILTDVTIIIREKEKVGLVGQNGTGKSTILKIVAGELSPDGGSIAVKKGATIGYLPQEANFDSDRTLYDEVEGVFEDVLALEQEMRKLEKKMADPAVYNNPEELDRLMRTYAATSDSFEREGGFQVKARINSILQGLGFTPEQFEQPVASMSGGEKTRVLLAKLLLQEPDVLLMDEPTNHLDVRAVQWLEEYLRDYRGAVLIVSHDRYFLDEIVTRIYELSNGRCTEYHGNYSDYAAQKQTALLLQEASYKNQQKEIERLERAWRQTLAWAHQARSHKLKVKADNIRRRLERIDRIPRPDLNPRTIRMHLEANQRSGKKVLTIEGLRKDLPGRTLFQNVSLEVRLGDKIALVGPNGVGKSTLLRLILGFTTADAGTIQLGANVSIAYFDQEHLDLDPTKTCFQEIMDTKRMNNFEARSLLAQFMFTGDDVFKTIGQLSGGEKSRVQLAKLTVTDANFLILDEPTNHLDLPSIEVLENALGEFDGTILFVSHDRYFINQVANKIAELTPNGIKVYDGNYDVYLEEKAKEAAELAAMEQTAKLKNVERKPSRTSQENNDSTAALRAKIANIEAQVEELEVRIIELEEQMADPNLYADPDALAEIAREHKLVSEELEQAYQEWDELTDLLADQLKQSG